MYTYFDIKEDAFGYFDVEATRDKGHELAESYRLAEPFPHAIIDNFLPEIVLNRCLKEFPTQEDPDSQSFNRDQERLKTSYNPEYLMPQVRSLFYSFNSRPFINFLENLTGIQGLICDPYFDGGGFHQIKQGGHLSVHADFNHHEKLNLERRINVLIYLNKDWNDEFGGQLELWDKDMNGCVVSTTPIFNRCVIFNTTSKSFHGNPHPIDHPGQVPRRSIALYYYTATWNDLMREQTTQFRPRPNSTDKFDWPVFRAEMADEYLPPVFIRNFRRVLRKLNL